MRFFPRSLFGRLTLVLLTGLVAAQLLSASILFRDRGQILYGSIRSDSAKRTAGIVRLLDALTPAERDRLLPLLETPETRIRLASAPIEMPDRDPVDSDLADAIQRELSDHLPSRSSVLVALERGPPTEVGPMPMAEMHHRHMMGRPGMRSPGAYLHGVHSMARGFFIQVALQDGTWVQFERRIPEDLFDQPTPLLQILGVLLLSVVLLSLLAVRWAVRPLRELRLAAEALGRDIHHTPISEAGPLEVAETARAFNTMQKRIRSYIEDRARILAAVSHDLKTPLTRMRLRSDLLDNTELRSKLQADLDEMEAMVAATLDFMRSAESGEESVPIDLTALLETIRDNALDAGWKVSLLGRASGLLEGRPTALKRCITNLVENAARYAGEARILVADSPGIVRITVEDQGPGVPEELLEKVFDPFFRVDTSRARRTGGTGLGLGIARNIARAHGGDLVLRNRTGGGLVAELTLPR